MKRLILPFLLTLCFYIESIFVDFLPPGSFGVDWILVPHFLIVLFILMGIFYFRNRTLIYAAIFGLLFDIYYTEVIGIYLVLFPVAVYVASKIVKLIFSNIFTAFIITIICISLVETIVYGMNIFVLQKSMDLNEFAMNRLVPTLILNAVFFLIVYYPFNKLLLNRKKEELNE
ncbi:rod shape-determining protein MreD [Lederbergia wuyishanensis]|uniref:Rod shape-determining protein MreD n=1 Tax=Lederbergia wuyishanensis TaxID=1347903 RepID=A0ABU0D1T5_9BACI|nr:rod shape-determining protein MreD [Lederbergia wuyishanensis]MCJ8006980.1 rod shape-determining protein MreD [Lederbergia wuyishanensis]MDQ0342364.1 rod shape-determining protein MreD [Lederbergia wuyishanensis]